MGVPVKSLLSTMLVKRGMHESGTTHPHPVFANATRILVERLQQLGNEEDIDIDVISSEPIFVRYIRTKNGEVLAEINMTNQEQSSKSD